LPSATFLTNLYKEVSRKFVDFAFTNHNLLRDRFNDSPLLIRLKLWPKFVQVLCLRSRFFCRKCLNLAYINFTLQAGNVRFELFPTIFKRLKESAKSSGINLAVLVKTTHTRDFQLSLPKLCLLHSKQVFLPGNRVVRLL